ncbi:decapping and exoribonuclease protein-like [Tigriopus californicus]|uniref:decapping and exoribonuclease protein-like n=1 Tax=Tigriopus californicus TaxID=6832 RepID=UPI0027DA5E92|nr:decapping and exoribonuclease protein-like [Tigriopus californicus]
MSKGYGAMEKRRVKDSDLGDSAPKSGLCVNSRYLDQPFPNFRKPVLIGSFSVNAQRQFQPDNANLKFLHRNVDRDERVSFDLNRGMNSVTTKNEDETTQEGIKMLLTWISLNQGKFTVMLDQKATKASSLNTDFVCFRGLMTCIMCTPYEYREGWTISAVKFKDTIYLLKIESEAQATQRRNWDDKMKRILTWGYKFEQYMMTDQPGQEPDANEPMNTNEEFCGMFRTRLGSHSLVYGAEMDGLVMDTSAPQDKDAIDLTQAEFAELKCSRQMDHPKQERNFVKYKLIKWWAQSFLVGVPKVICGFRDDRGTVNSLRSYPVTEMPKLGKRDWLPNVCMNFLNNFLSFVKAEMSRSTEGEVVQFVWNHNDDFVQCVQSKLPRSFILSDEYVEKLSHQ